MDEIERGFNIISRALNSKKFSKFQLEYIVKFCDAIKNDTNRILARIAESEKNEQGTQQ